MRLNLRLRDRRDLLRPLRVAIHRSVGDDTDRRWLTRARLGLTDPVASADPPWVDFQQLPLLAAFPARLLALRQQEVVVRKVGRRVVLEPVDAWPQKFLACMGAWPEELSRPKDAPIRSLRDPFE